MFLSQPPLMLSWDGSLSPHVVSTNTELRAASLLLDGGENSVSIRLLLTLPITSNWGGGGVQTPNVVSTTAGVQDVHCQPSRMIQSQVPAQPPLAPLLPMVALGCLFSAWGGCTFRLPTQPLLAWEKLGNTVFSVLFGWSRTFVAQKLPVL